MPDYKKEWFSKSQVDYFSSFLSLWLSCNSWYNFHYSLANDREHINKVKSDFSNANKLFKEFDKLFNGALTKEQKSLFANIELLYYSLNRKLLNTSSLIKPLTFENVLLDYNQKSNASAYSSIIIKDAKTAKGKMKTNISGVDFGDIVFVNDSKKVFAGLFEIIYQVRCLLVHGELDPTDDHQEIIKYCYLILVDLMRPFCT